MIFKCVQSKNLYYFCIDNMLVGCLTIEFGDKICVVKTLFFEKNVPLSKQIDCLEAFQKYIGCELTPENIYKHKTLWMSFFSNTNQILAKL